MKFLMQPKANIAAKQTKWMRDESELNIITGDFREKTHTNWVLFYTFLVINISRRSPAFPPLVCLLYFAFKYCIAVNSIFYFNCGSKSINNSKSYYWPPVWMITKAIIEGAAHLFKWILGVLNELCTYVSVLENFYKYTYILTRTICSN